MKLNYKRMMEQVTLTDEARAALRSRLSEFRRGRRWGRAIQIAAIVACMCLLLAVGAFAAGTVAGFISIDRYEFGDISGQAYSGYRMNGGIIPIAVESLSEELSAQEPGSNTRVFSSRKEAEQFTGINLRENSILEQMAVSYAVYSDLDNRAHCIVRFLVGEQGVKSASVAVHYQGAGADTAYLPDDIMVNLHARIVTEHGVSNSAFDVLYPSAKELVIERYEAAGGVEAVLIQEGSATSVTLDGVDYEQVWYSAYFALDGVAYSLSVVGYEQVGNAAVRPVLEFLKAVLDGYKLAVP